ncbi:MAG: hypothetical protein E7525_04175 [Ruminococcaceae bacterium]|nr:hypothetical protein [Oscillospiraceae bacterium]
MPGQKKDGLVEEQRKRQAELLELKRKKQEFQENIDEFVPEGPRESVPLKGMARVENFFHYAKGTIIGVLIVAVILTVAVVQCATRTVYDCTVVLYMKQGVNSTMVENLSTVLEKYCEDKNGDGEVNVLVMDCAITDEQRMSDLGQSKSTRLMAQFASEEAIVYIVDKAALEELIALDDGNFVSNSLQLPAYDGKAYPLNGTIFDAAFDVVLEDHSKGFEYYIIKRNVAGTAIEGKKDVAEFSQQADKLISNIIADPNLEQQQKPELDKIEVSSK